MIRRNTHLKMARYHQHLHELLDLDLSPLDYMMKTFPDVKEKEDMRKIIGRYGLSGKQQVIICLLFFLCPIFEMFVLIILIRKVILFRFFRFFC